MMMGWEKMPAEREDSEESLVDKLLSTFPEEKWRRNGEMPTRVCERHQVCSRKHGSRV